jgi:hypothetical protein
MIYGGRGRGPRPLPHPQPLTGSREGSLRGGRGNLTKNFPRPYPQKNPAIANPLALGILAAAAGAPEAVFFPLFDAGIPGEKTGFFQDGT